MGKLLNLESKKQIINKHQEVVIVGKFSPHLGYAIGRIISLMKSGLIVKMFLMKKMVNNGKQKQIR